MIDNCSIYFCESRIRYIALQCQILKKYPAFKKPNVHHVLCISQFSFLSSRLFNRHCFVPRTRTTYQPEYAPTPHKQSLKIPKRQSEATNWRTNNIIVKRKTINHKHNNAEWAHCFCWKVTFVLLYDLTKWSADIIVITWMETSTRLY